MGYQGKQLFKEYGLPVSEGYAADTAQGAVEAADRIGGNEWVVKCQVHAGGRGKAGGVKLVKNKDDIRAFAENWLGKNLVTFQTDENGQPVSKILVESCTDIANELYLGAVVDRTTRRVVFMASTEGGVEIETVAEETPEKILKAEIDPIVGPQPYHRTRLNSGIVSSTTIKRKCSVIADIGQDPSSSPDTDDGYYYYGDDDGYHDDDAFGFS